jgi:hypothetical protein
MASSARKETPEADPSVAAVIDAEELSEAQRDPRVAAFLEEADAYLAELERQGRNR